MRRHGLVSLMLVGACGGGGGPAIEDLPGDFEQAYCEAMVRCGEMPDVATCMETLALAEDGDIQTLLDSVEAGRTEYDSGKAEDCLAQFDDFDCTISGGPIFDDSGDNPCDLVFVGTIPDGGACIADEECAGGGECQETPGCTMACCEGTCVASEPPPDPIAIGGDCSGGGECVAGAYCKNDFTMPTATCEAEVGEGGVCEDFDACSQGLFCTFDLMTEMGTCQRPPGEGDPCEIDGFAICDRVDNYCDPTTMVCTRRPGVGDACDVQQDACVDYATCVAGTCEARPALGDTCIADGPECLGDTTCMSGVCTAPEPDPTCPLPA